MRSLTRYFAGSGGDKIPLDGSYASTLVKGETQVFVKDFVGHKLKAPSLSEFEITGVSTSAYSDGLGNIVIPSLSDINYASAFGVDLGEVTGIFEVYDDGVFLESGDLGDNPVSVPTDMVGPFIVRYLLESQDVDIATPVFVDPSSPLMDPVPIIGAGAVAPPYTASESSFLNNANTFGVKIVFDNRGTASSHTDGGANPPHWYQVIFQASYVVTSYKIWGHFSDSLPDLPVNYELQGSNDGGANWTAVDTQVNNPPPTTTQFPFNDWVSGGETIPHLTLQVQNPGSYMAYRFYCTVTTPRTILRIRELQLIGYAA